MSNLRWSGSRWASTLCATRPKRSIFFPFMDATSPGKSPWTASCISATWTPIGQPWVRSRIVCKSDKGWETLSCLAYWSISSRVKFKSFGPMKVNLSAPLSWIKLIRGGVSVRRSNRTFGGIFLTRWRANPWWLFRIISASSITRLKRVFVCWIDLIKSSRMCAVTVFSKSNSSKTLFNSGMALPTASVNALSSSELWLVAKPLNQIVSPSVVSLHCWASTDFP